MIYFNIPLVLIVPYLLFRRDQFALHVNISEISLMYMARRTRGTTLPQDTAGCSGSGPNPGGTRVLYFKLILKPFRLETAQIPLELRIYNTKSMFRHTQQNCVELIFLIHFNKLRPLQNIFANDIFIFWLKLHCNRHKSVLYQVMDFGDYYDQCWPISLTPFSVTVP